MIASVALVARGPILQVIASVALVARGPILQVIASVAFGSTWSYSAGDS